ncbi:MAG TPA: DNA primase [Candidatus Paceibacterota bacterium]
MSDTAQLVKDKLDIVDFLKQYLKVTPAGKNFKALCPFHKEKTPSFMISTERQAWHCFGCSKGGDIIKFLMEYENLEFYDALKVLAEKAGVDIRVSGNRDFKNHDTLYVLLDAAKNFFKQELEKSPEIKEYALNRGLKPETIQEFEVGFAPAGSDSLQRHLLKLGARVTDLEKVGLVLKTDRGTYWDRFRNRLMFPIYNHFGKVVGFTGRVLPGQENTAMGKYVNSPETPIFQKSKLLYGFHKTKNAIRETGTVVLVEGQMDFLMAWQDGITNVVATSGTALTKDHLIVLRRLTENLVVSFDGDDAGIAAAERAVDLAGTLDFNAKVTLLSGAKDPAEIAQKEPGKLRELIQQALPAMQYYFYKYLQALKGASIGEKKKGIRAVLGKIVLLESAVEKSYWLKELSGMTDIDEQALFEEMNVLKTSAQNTRDAVQEITLPEKLSRRDMISQRILELTDHAPHLRELLAGYQEFLSPVYKNMLEQSSDFNEAATATSLRASFKLGYLDPEKIDSEFQDLLKQLKFEHLKEKRKQIKLVADRAEADGDMNTYEVKTKEFQAVSEELQNLK